MQRGVLDQTIDNLLELAGTLAVLARSLGQRRKRLRHRGLRLAQLRFDDAISLLLQPVLLLDRLRQPLL